MFVRLTIAFCAPLALLACVGATRLPADPASVPTPPLASDASDELPRADEGVMYAMGASLGTQLKDYELDEAEVREATRGFFDAAARRPYAGLRHEQTAEQVAAWDERRKRALAAREELAGGPFLEAAARADGAVRTETGLVVTVLAPGSGPPPTIYDFVRVRFHGMLRDGTVFDSNRGREPDRVRLGTTIRCWQQALGAAARGARLHVVCPPALGYGVPGWPGVVPGGSVLIYELELLDVIPAPPP